MKRKIFTAITLLLIFQLLSCVSIFRFERDRRDVNYTEGVELYKQNNFAETHDRFEIVVNIDPEYKDAKAYLKKTERLLALKVKNEKQQSNINYDKGVSLMKKGRYDDALGFLLLAQEQESTQVDVEDKIDECRAKLVTQFDSLVKQVELQYQRKQYIPAYRTGLNAQKYNPSSSKLSSLMDKIENILEGKAEKFVIAGTQFYNDKKYAAAQTQLNRALGENPWDKKSKELLSKINEKLNLDKNYQRGITLFNNARFFDAKNAFNQVNATEPGYKKTEEYLTKINNAIAGQIDVYYNNGVSYYNKGNFEASIAEFNKVLAINPSHSNAREYRQRAQTKMEIQKSVSGGDSD
jgi:tetratricopeptide (TPR) repeat protein